METIYDRACNTSFHQNIESIQYKAALAITGAVRRTSKEKLFNKDAGIENFVSYSKQLKTSHRVISFN